MGLPESSTLKSGDRAPEFSLPAANENRTVTLADVLKNGGAILEFLRGTW